MTPENGAEGTMEEKATETEVPTSSEQPAEAPVAEAAAAPQSEGRRTQLRIVREGVEDLRTDVWKLTRSHESRTSKLEAQVKSLREELSAHARSKELTEMVKKHSAETKALHKEVKSLHEELAALKSSTAKDAARTKAREEAAFSRILAKVSKKTATAKAPAKRKKKK